jgi:hypothetical protein
MKGGTKMMTNDFSADFHRFMTEICILLFLRTAVTSRRRLSASKSQKLLIMDDAVKTNQIQREFDSNVAIATQEFSSASKHLREKTNFFKQRRAIKASLSIVSLRTLWGGAGGGDCTADTNRIQREFLFNNCIQSQNLSSASKNLHQKTNFPKRGVL